MQWEDKSFSDLSLDQLFLIYQLRAIVFNEEQHCNVPDPDENDRKAHHVFAMDQGHMVAYARYYPLDQQKVSFGRVAVACDYRGQGLGKELISHVMQGIQQNYAQRPILIHSQYYIQKLYRQLGFTPVGQPFLEAGIKHIAMTHPAL